MAAPATASPKAGHYDAALTKAILRGLWADANPGTAPNGTQLSWGELVRKWGKHTGGNTSLIHHLRDISLSYQSTSPSSSGFLQITAPPSAAIASGSTNSSADETTTTHSGSSFIHVPHPHLRRHKSRASLNETSSHATVRPEATAGGSGGTRAAYLSAGDLDGDDLPEDGYWGEGKGWWSGVGSEGLDEVKEGIKALEGLIAKGSLRPGELQSARLTLAYHLHAIGSHGASHEAALQIYTTVFDSDPRSGVLDGDAAVVERIRGRCLQGMSAELQSSPDPSLALQSYLATIPLLRSLTSFPAVTPPYLASSSSKPLFDSHRELHRFLSTALTRAAILSARQLDSNALTLRILRTYHSFAPTFAPSFRPNQRQRMIMLYLRALYSGYPLAASAPQNPYLLDETIQAPPMPARGLWRKEASEAIRLGRSLLSSTTSFPRAGAVNRPVVDFATLSVALADKCPALAREVVSVLWWAMTLTFQSQCILRHLTRLLVSVGDADDARRTFELYVRLVLKSRETQQPDVSLQLKRRPTDDAAASPTQIETDAEEQTAKKDQAADVEFDSDEDFVEALLVGSRLLMKDLGEVEESWRYVSLAGEVVGKAPSRFSRALRAQVEEAKGIVRMAMGMEDAEPSTRPTYQAQAINHLNAAVALQPSSATAHYHLAFAQAEARNIDAAAESIRSSLELDSNNVQSWHLLALVLTAQNDWEAARKACEAGVSVWESGEADEDDDAEHAVLTDPNVASKDFGLDQAAPASEAVGSEPLLLPSGHFHPARIRSKPPTTELSCARKLEHVIRLRMTLNVITEKTLGAEAAMLRHQELFAFFSARTGRNAQVAGGKLVNSASFSSVPTTERDLGGSYISVNVEAPRQASGIVEVQPPTPIAEHPVQQQQPAPSIRHSPLVSAASSPGGSSRGSETDSPGEMEVLEEKGVSGSKGRKGLRGTKNLVARHLHVPHGGSSRSSRPSSVRRLPMDELAVTDSAPRQRTASTSSTALSLAPTAVHSHFRGSQHSSTPTPPPPPISTATETRSPLELRILSNLWLMSAATFRRWGKTDQCLVSIEEAETLDPTNPDVWVQLGLYHRSLPSGTDNALKSFTKAILLKPDHPPATVNLAKLYLATNQTELAHSLLNQMTQDSAWDVAEAWFYLGKVCEIQGRDERARECWRYALELQERRPARRWSESIERWL